MEKTDTERVIAAIDDTIVRRLVRIAIHLRGYAVYYAATIAFGLVLLLVPLGTAGGGRPAADTSAAAGGAASGAGGSGASSERSDSGTFTDATATSLFDDARPLASAAPAFETPAGGQAADTAGEPRPGAATSAAPSGSPATPVDPPDPSAEPCQVRPGAPAPAVTPAREARNAQTTAEAASGADAPVDSGDAVETVTDTVGCPDDANDVVPPTPGIPLPV